MQHSQGCSRLAARGPASPLRMMCRGAVQRCDVISVATFCRTLGADPQCVLCVVVRAVGKTTHQTQVLNTAVVPAQDDMPTAAAEQSGPTPQQPVLVLDMDAAPDAEPGTLGFGRLQVAAAWQCLSPNLAVHCDCPLPMRVQLPCTTAAAVCKWDCRRLQVKEASEVPGAVQGSLESGLRQSDASLQQPQQQAAPAADAQPIIGEVVDRPTSGVPDRPATSHMSAAAKGSMAPGNASRPSRFAAQRTGGESAVSSGDSSMPGAQPADGSGSADGVNSAAADAAAEQVMAAAAQRLEADMADINAHLEADIAELSSASDDDDDEKAQGSDAESEGSEQSTFDSINMASALDMGQSWCRLTSPSRGPAASLTPTLWVCSRWYQACGIARCVIVFMCTCRGER